MDEKQKLAYLAAIIDGEGNISLDPRRNPRNFDQWSARLTVANTDKRLIEWLHANFGGFIWVRNRNGDRENHKNWKDCHFWIKTVSSTSRELIKSLIPLSIIKKERLELLEKFLATKKTSGKFISEETRAYRNELSKQVKALNKRGI